MDEDALVYDSIKRQLREYWADRTWHTIVGLVLLGGAIFMGFAFLSYFSTGADDQSLLESANASGLTQTDNGIANSMGAVGARMSSYLINDCFGVAAFFIALFVGVAALKLLKMCHVVLWKWFLGCVFLLVWGSM